MQTNKDIYFVKQDSAAAFCVLSKVFLSSIQVSLEAKMSEISVSCTQLFVWRDKQIFHGYI